MAHIKLAEGLPGIRGLFAFRPETARPLCELAEVLLHQPNSLSAADRELIATYVSSQNDCSYCQKSHGAIAAHHLGGNEVTVDEVKKSQSTAAIPDKLKALLAIAGKIHEGGTHVQPEDIEKEIHDVVLIAAAFCVYNRYVDGLGTWAPEDLASYRERAAAVATGGYLRIPATIG